MGCGLLVAGLLLFTWLPAGEPWKNEGGGRYHPGPSATGSHSPGPAEPAACRALHSGSSGRREVQGPDRVSASESLLLSSSVSHIGPESIYSFLTNEIASLVCMKEGWAKV